MRDPKNSRSEECTAKNRAYRPARRGNTGPVPSRAGIRAENRRRRRRRALLIFYLFLFFTVVAAAVVLSLTVLFKIDSIQVSGTSRYSQQQILGACGIKKGENLFLTNVKDAEKRIQTRLPYIGTVRVKRKLPAKISVQVTEAQICGAVAYSKKYAILGKNLRVLEVSDKLPRNCALLRGVTLKSAKPGSTAEFSNSSQLSALKEVESAAKRNGLTRVTGMDFSSLSKILVNYDGRITMNLGTSSGLDYKFRYAKELFDKGKIKSTEKGTLDLSTVEDNDTAYFDPSTSS